MGNVIATSCNGTLLCSGVDLVLVGVKAETNEITFTAAGCSVHDISNAVDRTLREVIRNWDVLASNGLQAKRREDKSGGLHGEEVTIVRQTREAVGETRRALGSELAEDHCPEAGLTGSIYPPFSSRKSSSSRIGTTEVVLVESLYHAIHETHILTCKLS